MVGWGSLQRRCWLVVFLLIALAYPLLSVAECFSIPAPSPLKIHLRCSYGPEFKVVSATGREPAAAKIRLPGPFGSAEFLGVYLKPGEVVKLIGVRKRDNGPERVEQILYAFTKGQEVYWLAFALPQDPTSRRIQVIHNLSGGKPQVERISGTPDLPIPRGYKLVEQRLEVPNIEDAYARLGL